jgi:hypothetical protein
MILQLSDFPADKNWTLKTRFERAKSDVSYDSVGRGWIKGYSAQYYRIGSLLDATQITEWISVYPIENITQLMDHGTCRDSWKNESVNSGGNITYDELSKPKVGDDAISCRIKWTDDYGNTQSEYIIEFIKSDVYMALDMSGATLDYEFFKDMAIKAAAKIA